MPLSDKMLKELMATFQAELEEHLSTLNKGLLVLEKTPVSEERTKLLTDIFRAAHSIKGASRAVNLKDIETIAHRIEDILEELRDGRLSLKPQHIDILLASVDSISAVMAVHLRDEKMPAEFLTSVLTRIDEIVKGQGESGASQDKVSTPPEVKPSPAVPQAPVAPPPAEKPPVPEPSSQGMKPKDSGSLPSASQSGASPAPVKEQQSVSPHPTLGEDTIRVRTTKLDALMDGLGELLVMQMRTEKLMSQMKSLQEHVIHWQKIWRKVRPHIHLLQRHYIKEDKTDFDPMFEFLENNEQEIKGFNNEVNTLLDRLNNDRNHLQIVTDDLQNGIRSTRMLPIATLFDLFPRMIRDLAHDQNKDILLQIEGQDTEVDRQALELMKDPLTHLLRNSADHGLEPPEERLALGKPRQGTIRLRAEQSGSNLVLTISDDGRGINLDAVRRAAIERGLVTPEKMSELDDSEVTELIFYSGLSTARQVTDLSGRGVGMDVVRRNLDQARGMIQVETTLNVGTTFILTLPLTLATSQVLLARVSGEMIGLPMMNVERILYVNVSKVGSLNGNPAIYADGRPLPLVSLAHILKLHEVEQPLPPDAKISVVILSVLEKRIALRVNSFLTTQQLVIKSLGGQLHSMRNVAGGAILGDGQLVIILNASDLMRSIHGKSVAFSAMPVVTKEARRWRVLLADDSITTRALEKHILENAGYDVMVAADGQEAWDSICNNEQGSPDLVVSDINMPRMDGFVLTQSIKGNSKYARIPVVLVTSLDSPQGRLHGMDAGADAYIVKGTFDQRELLSTIERLIG